MRTRATLIFTAFVTGLGCAASGPPFEVAPQPTQGLAQVYVYRTSEDVPSYDYGETVSIDGLKLANLRAPRVLGFAELECQYLWLDVEPGRHQLVAESASLWNLGSANPVEIEMEAGQVYFVRIHRVLSGVGFAVSSGGPGPMMISAGKLFTWDIGSGSSWDVAPLEIRRCRLVEGSPAEQERDK